MPQQTRKSQSQSLTHSITPGAVVVGAAAAAGAILAGKWLYDNSDKVTMFIDEMTDALIGEASDLSDDLGPITSNRGPIGTVDSEHTSSKRIPVH